jgi:hypothetical protein
MQESKFLLFLELVEVLLLNLDFELLALVQVVALLVVLLVVLLEVVPVVVMLDLQN